MNKQNISFTLGERLKDLREKRGLSHDKLKKQLNEKYGISVSRDSLMAYEISDETRAKASKFPNLGMRVEYLYCLADFYGVSLDYLLGKSTVPVPDGTVSKVCEYTGLSENAVVFLNKVSKYRISKIICKVIDALLNKENPTSSGFIRAVLMSADIRVCFGKNLVADKTREEYFKETEKAREKNRERIESGESSIEISLGDAMALYEDRAVYAFRKILRKVMIEEFSEQNIIKTAPGADTPGTAKGQQT